MASTRPDFIPSEKHHLWRVTPDRRFAYKLGVITGTLEEAQAIADSLPDQVFETLIDPKGFAPNLVGWWQQDPPPTVTTPIPEKRL